MRKKSHGTILRDEPKEQHLSTVYKSCSNIYIYIYIPFYIPNTHFENLLFYFYFLNFFIILAK